MNEDMVKEHKKATSSDVAELLAQEAAQDLERDRPIDDPGGKSNKRGGSELVHKIEETPVLKKQVTDSPQTSGTSFHMFASFFEVVSRANECI